MELLPLPDCHCPMILSLCTTTLFAERRAFTRAHLPPIPCHAGPATAAPVKNEACASSSTPWMSSLSSLSIGAHHPRQLELEQYG
jgi:hypothetical protein